MTIFDDYPQLDLTALNEAAKGAYNEGITIERLYTQTAYLPSLSLKIARIDGALRTAHYKLKETLQSLSIPAAISLQLINRYQTAYNRAPDSSKPGVIARMADEVSKILNLASHAKMSLKQLSAPLLETVELDATHRFLVQLAVEAEQIPLDIEALNLRKEALDQERKTLTDALSLIESKGFAQVGKDTILNAQEVSKLALAAPELAILEQAIEFAHKVLDQAQDLVNYVSLTNARDVIRRRIGDLLSEIASKVEGLRLVRLRQELITATHRFDDHRITYTAEFKKIDAALSMFLQTHIAADLQDDEFRAGLIAQANALIIYLNSIVLNR
ncbi:MAG: alpha-xenorhabdolysin family binary toxin subunit B [Pseudomonas sp.]|uniref:alpha-xenorhabdolysin family binary toxin subunit B n=1 Tax=Pseudomonas sp. TaxID=306 RepID=UPI003D6FFDAF